MGDRSCAKLKAIGVACSSVVVRHGCLRQSGPAPVHFRQYLGDIKRVRSPASLLRGLVLLDSLQNVSENAAQAPNEAALGAARNATSHPGEFLMTRRRFPPTRRTSSTTVPALSAHLHQNRFVGWQRDR